jgi:hypothetical protein
MSVVVTVSRGRGGTERPKTTEAIGAIDGG